MVLNDWSGNFEEGNIYCTVYIKWNSRRQFEFLLGNGNVVAGNAHGQDDYGKKANNSR